MSASRALLFDLDGTLVDSVPDLSRAVDQMLQALGRDPVGSTRVSQWVGNGVDMLVRRALAGSLNPPAEGDDEILPLALELFQAAYAQANGRSSQVYPGVGTLLEYCRENAVPMAVVTNKPTAFTGPLLARLELAGFFQQVVCGDTLAQKKPHPAPLVHACEQLEVTVDRVTMIGDSRVDVEAARAAGCAAVCVSYGYNRGEPVSRAGADLVVDSLAELIDTPFIL